MSTYSYKPPSRALIRAEEGPRPAAPLSREIQELWFATLRRPWRVLALVPAHAGGSALPLARSLAQIGSLHRGMQLQVVSAEGMGLDQIAQLTMELMERSAIAARADQAAGCLVVLDPIVSNPLGTAIALAADAVLLCLEYGTSDLDSARRTIEQIGHERFVGCAVIKKG